MWQATDSAHMLQQKAASPPGEPAAGPRSSEQAARIPSRPIHDASRAAVSRVKATKETEGNAAAGAAAAASATEAKLSASEVPFFRL